TRSVANRITELRMRWPLRTPFEALPQDDQREHLEQHLGPYHRGIAGRVVLRRDLDHVAANRVYPAQAMQDPLSLAGREPAHLGCAGAGREGRIETVDIERNVGRAVADDLEGPLDHALDAHLLDVLDMKHRHAGIVGKFPQELGGAANADLNGAPGI